MDDASFGLSYYSDNDSSLFTAHRRKKSVPRRSAFDAATTTAKSDFLEMSESRQGAAHSACADSGAAITNASTIDQAPTLRTHQPAQTSAPATQPAAFRRTVVHRRKSKHDLAGPCNHCGALTSPQWRKGPKGKPVLCNACGIRFLRNRTLTKVMPKKRRQVAGAAGSVPKRIKVTTEGDDDYDDEDVMAAAEDSLTAAADGTEEALSALIDLHTQHPSNHTQPEHSSLVMAAAAAAAADEDSNAAGAEVAADRDAVADVEQLSGLGYVSDTPLLLPARTVAVKSRGAAPAATRQLQLGNRPSRNLLAELGDCPSLALALALHQHQQRQQQQHRPDHLSAPLTLPYFPQLQLFAPGSPASESAVTGVAGIVAATSAVASPLSSTSGMLPQHLHQQHYYQDHGTESPPLSPLLAVTGRAASAPISASSPDLSATAAAGAAPEGIVWRAEPQPADILQLVQQLGAALGGVGPAVEFLKLCSNNPAAVAAAVAAVAACTTATASQQRRLL